MTTNLNEIIADPQSQNFLREVLEALDSLEEKVLIIGELESEGSFCAIGAVCHKRGINLTQPMSSSGLKVMYSLGVSSDLVGAISSENDKFYGETQSTRWFRMRSWVESQIVKEAV